MAVGSDRHAPQGVLTDALVSALHETAAQCAYQQLMERRCKALQWLQPVMIGRMADVRILEDRADPGDQRELGIAYLCVGDVEKAIAALRAARSHAGEADG